MVFFLLCLCMLMFFKMIHCICRMAVVTFVCFEMLCLSSEGCCCGGIMFVSRRLYLIFPIKNKTIAAAVAFFWILDLVVA